MSNWWERFGLAGVQTESEAAAAVDPMPPGSMPMIVGVYVGLVMGTMHPRFAGRIRRELEAEMAAAIGIPPEALEEDMRQLIASLTRPRR